MMARWEGFEPPTAWFVARNSIQLSYQRKENLLSFPAQSASTSVICFFIVRYLDACFVVRSCMPSV